MGLRFAYDGKSNMELTKTLTRLINFDTTSGNNRQIDESYNWIKAQLTGLPLFFSTVKSEDFESFIISSQRSKKFRVALAAHIDVVPVFDKSQLKAELKGNKLFGRGSYDMKSAIACYLKLLYELGSALDQYNIGLILTPDEEIGGFHGTQRVLEAGYRAESVILPDIGSSWSIERSAKGVYFCKLTARGLSGHGSRPWEGKNALYEAISVINELRHNFYDGSELDEVRKAKDTVSFGRIAGGEATNKILDKVEIEIDIRFTPFTGEKGVEKVLTKIARQHPNVTFEKIKSASASAINTQNKYVQSFKEIAEQRSQREISFVDSYGSSDARFYSALGIPVILMQSNGGGHHGPAEWCDMKDLERFYKVLKEYVERFAKV